MYLDYTDMHYTKTTLHVARPTERGGGRGSSPGPRLIGGLEHLSMPM